MAVEIQALVLCRGIANYRAGVADLLAAALTRIHPASGAYPCDVTPRFYMLLRKDSREVELPVEIELRVLDEDGKTLDPPGVNLMKGVFPAGNRFWAPTGGIRMALPRPGDYSLLCAARDAEGVSHYRYDFEAGRGA